MSQIIPHLTLIFLITPSPVEILKHSIIDSFLDLLFWGESKWNSNYVDRQKFYEVFYIIAFLAFIPTLINPFIKTILSNLLTIAGFPNFLQIPQNCPQFFGFSKLPTLLFAKHSSSWHLLNRSSRHISHTSNFTDT